MNDSSSEDGRREPVVHVSSPGASTRPLVWALHMILPIIGLVLLVRNPMIDLGATYYVAHFVIVSLSALASFGVGYLISEAARRRADFRLFFVGMAFLSSAGFLFIHALCTPGILVRQDTSGFEMSVPIGIALSAVFAVVSSLDLPQPVGTALLRSPRAVRTTLVVVLLIWAAASLAELTFTSGANAVSHIVLVRRGLAVVGVPLFLVAALRYFLTYRKRRGVVLLSILTAFILLGEALLSIPIAPMWHLSWWLWHILLMIGFGYVGYSAHVEYRREGTAVGLFDGVGTRRTLENLRGEYGAALESLVTVIQRQEVATSEDAGREVRVAAHGLGSRFGLNSGQTSVLTRAAQALVGERAQLTRLGALVRVGREASVVLEEQEFLRRSLAHLGGGFEDLRARIGLLTDGELRFSPALGDTDDFRAPADIAALMREPRPADDGDGGLVLPLVVKGLPIGVLHVRPRGEPFDERDRVLLETVSGQLSIALENNRIYRQRDELIRRYMSPDIANTLLADPAAADLGGALVEVTALFADLRGFTTLSEQITPYEIVEVLNRYFAVATRAVLDEGGTVVQFVGDAMMALFNAPVTQDDHPLRACRAALAIQAGIAGLESGPDLPLFRIGVNTGAALVGNIGSTELRNYNAMGDAVNVAARLETSAEPGTVVISRATLGRLPGRPDTVPLGNLELKGRRGSIEAFVLNTLAPGA